MKLWQDFWEGLADLFFPPVCLGCEKDAAGHNTLCPECRAQMGTERMAARELHGLRYLDSCLILCEYEGVIRSLLQDLKYRNLSQRAKPLSEILHYSSWLSEIAGATEGVVPVPLCAGRLKERGYNQTERIFRPWAEEIGLSWDDVLVRSRDTLPQWELRVQARRQNVRGAFQLGKRPETVAKKKLLLADDIFTTGATMEECARVLKKAGAAAVHGVVIAGGCQGGGG